MKFAFTNGQLEKLVKDLQQQDGAITFLLHDKIERFYKMNAVRIRTLNTTPEQLIKKYVLHGMPADQSVKDAPKPLTETKDGIEVYQFASDELREKYMAEMNAFMQTTVDVFL
jgi:hypothetical protein